YALRLHQRARAIPAQATVTVTPPAASGLAARTLDGTVPELFDVDLNGQKVTYTADFTVAP
ncbi:MAG TPA: hypothetical protein VLK84_26000, partial [Longimicrobium sp.]|nr:hypothetical protein [Longimicrobium sp.]